MLSGTVFDFWRKDKGNRSNAKYLQHRRSVWPLIQVTHILSFLVTYIYKRRHSANGSASRYISMLISDM